MMFFQAMAVDAPRMLQLLASPIDMSIKNTPHTAVVMQRHLVLQKKSTLHQGTEYFSSTKFVVGNINDNVRI